MQEFIMSAKTHSDMTQLSIFDARLGVTRTNIDVSVEGPESAISFSKEAKSGAEAIRNGENIDGKRLQPLAKGLMEVENPIGPAPSIAEKLAGELLSAADALNNTKVEVPAIITQLRKAVADIVDPTFPPPPAKSLKERQAEFRRILAHATGSAEFYVHGGPWAVAITLTQGVHFVVENGGRSDRGTAFWLADVIASYQGEAKLLRMEIQFWKLELVLKDGAVRGGVVTCGNGNGKEIVRQELDYCDFILDEGIVLYVGWNYIEDATSKTGYKRIRTILLPSEY
jgi:hypothetical protein